MAALLALWLFHTSYTAIRDGYIRGKRAVIVRDEHPILFWVSVAIRTQMGMFITALPVWALIAHNKSKTRTSQTGTGPRAFPAWFVVRRSMQNRPVINFGECTMCGQGQLVPAKRVDTGELLVMCDDCESQWRSPDDVHSSNDVLMDETRVVDASIDEVVATGWDGHARAQGRGWVR
jgi:hypothetical protein